MKIAGKVRYLGLALLLTSIPSAVYLPFLLIYGIKATCSPFHCIVRTLSLVVTSHFVTPLLLATFPTL